TLTARENLRFWGSLYGLSGSALGTAVDRVLEQVGLTARARDRVRTYSGGMKRRLNLALGIVHGPKAVLMDEPTTGIDPQGRANILDTIRAVAAGGTTVLYTTHYLEEAETLCDRIGIMDHGKILVEGTLDELKARAGQEETVTIRGSFTKEQAYDRLGKLPGARLIHSGDSNVVLGVKGAGKGAAQLLADLFESGLPVDEISIQPPSLNSLFLNLTGRELRD
ncbi:MAG: ABC transporter ATP-binding protein, partial [Acidobacteria bacterium]|nr:ABC transporter ATP-binding protein [Acidobacteriota bacterium]